MPDRRLPWPAMSALGLLFSCPTGQAAQEAATLEDIIVRPNPPAPTLTAPDAGTAAAALRTVPGNVSLVPAEAYQGRATANLGDALSLTAGVYAQSSAGQEAVKLSIRGSGISTAFAMRGVRLLRDGLPLSRSDGYADTSWADAYTASYLEVYRGANALRHGVNTLGGAINLVSPTGHSHHGAGLRLEAGSNGHLRAQTRAGQAWDNVDAFVAVNRFQTEGSREHANQNISRLYANLGYRYNAVSEGRWHLSVERNHQRFPGGLTLAQLQQNPRQAAAGSLRVDERVELWPRVHLSYQHAWQPNANHVLKLGAYYAETRFNYPNTNLRLTYDAQEFGVTLRHEFDYQAGWRSNQVVWGINLGRGSSYNQTFGPVYLGNLVLDGGSGQFEDIHGGHGAREFFVEHRWQATPRLTLIAGAQAMHVSRHARRDVLRQPTVLPLFTAGAAHATYTGFSPMLGLTWQASPRIQWFANLSRSMEPPTGVEFHSSAGGILQAQRALTLEIGSRGEIVRPMGVPVNPDSRHNRHALLGWELALYHSRVRHELLGIESPPGSGRYITTNIDATRHSGIEATLHGHVPLAANAGSLEWRLAYTYSRYRVTTDAAFAGRALPGIPPHAARLSLTYRHPSGWYGGPNVELASSWYADQANTLKAPGYGVVNATLGYASPNDGWRAFLDLRNIGNKRYAATSDYLVAAGDGDAAVFYPGLSRAIFAGLEARW